MAVAMRMVHADDPKVALLKKLTDLDKIDVFNNQCIVAIYQRPERTKSGLFIPDQARAEEKWQGKAALVVKAGSGAFKPDPEKGWFLGAAPAVGDWIVMRPSDGWPLTINEVDCRVISDTAVRARVSEPDMVW